MGDTYSVGFLWKSVLEPLDNPFKSQIHDGHSASLSCCQAPIWDPRPNFSFLSSIIFKPLGVC
jgi:hypothetical protein